MPPQPARDGRAWWAALALIALAVVVLHHEVIFAGRVYHMDDAADGYYPCHVAIARAYAEGALPAWERGAAAGWPLVADPYYGAFYPLGVVFGLLGAARGLGAQIVLHTILCAAGMLLLLRRRGLSPGAAAFGAASLALSSFLVCRIRHIIFPEGLAWLTFALAGAEGYLATRARRELALVAIAIGLMLLCGALPLLPFFGLFAALYLLPRVLAAARPIGAALALAGAAGLGLLLASAQLVPTLAHLPLSPRALGTSVGFAGSYAWPRLDYLATLLVPDLFGTEERARWFGAYNHWELAAYYTGLWAALLAPLAFLRARRGEVALLWLAALVGIGLAFGDAGPLHGWFYRHVPLYAALRCPTRALVMTMLALSVLGAEGVEALAARLPPAHQPAPWRIRAVASFLAGIVLAWALARTHLFYPGKGAIPAAVLEGRHAFSHFIWVLGGGAALLCLLRAGLMRRTLAPAFALLAMVELVAVDRGYLQPQPAEYVEGTDRFQAVDWLIAQHPSERFAADPHGPFRLHNLGMSYGLEGAAAYSSLQVLRYVNFLEVLATGRGLPSPLRIDPAASDVRRFDTPLVDLLNVRWVISDHAPAPGYVERFRPAAGSKRPAARFEPSWDRRLSVWENPHALPRAFLVYGARVVAGEGSEQDALARLDPRRWALLDRAPGLALPTESDRPIEPASAFSATRDRVVIEAGGDAPAILVVGEAHYPGWSATVDGHDVPLLRADYALRGVALPPGRHHVELRYGARPVRVGLGLSALALLGLVALLTLGGRTRNPDEPVLG